jgi:hypothetical protein
MSKRRRLGAPEEHLAFLSHRRGKEFVMIRTTLIAAALAGGFALAAPASAAPLAPASAAVATAGSAGLIEQVQYRRYYGPRYGYYGRGYRYNRGAAVGAGIAAGALGALAAGALLAPGPVYAEPVPPPARVHVEPDADAIAYCSRRFRSYDPETGTYIGAGGVVRSCP